MFQTFESSLGSHQTSSWTLLLFLLLFGLSPVTQWGFMPLGFTVGLKPLKQLSASGDRR